MRALRASAFIVLVATPRLASAADYYVAPGGNDADDGSQATPWLTLQHAADQVVAGDTVHVADGDYTGFEVTTAGTRFIAEGNDVRIVADAPTRPDGINVEGADDVVIDGFITNSRTRTGVRCALSSNVTIRRIRADGNGRWGILTGCCPNVTIEDNVTTGSIDEHGIYHSNSADGAVIRRNVIYGNNANGIHMNGDASITCDNITTDGVISNAVVERNVIYDNGTAGGSGINCDGVADSVIRNNLIYQAHASGISLYMIDAGAPATGNLIVNNTVVVASDGRWALNIRDGSTGNTVRNNIFLTHHAFRGSIVITDDSRTGFSSDYNVLTPVLSADGDATFLNLAEWQALGYDQNSVASDPANVFVDSVAEDYHLSATSPALDTADPATATSSDLEGNGRPAGLGPDIGAYEMGGTPVDGGVPLPNFDGGGAGAPGAGGASSGDGGGPGAAGSPGAGGAAPGAGGAAGTGAGDGGSGPSPGGASSAAGGGGGAPSGAGGADAENVDAGAEAEGSSDSGDDGGCGCRTAGAPQRSTWAWLVTLAGAAALRRRR